MSQLSSKVIPNLVQGVSQQAAQQRRDSQCEVQLNCINSPKNGAVARPGFDLVAAHETDLSGAYMFELFRGTEEHYLVTIKGGTVRVFNFETGVECTVNVIAPYNAYLASDGGDPRTAYCRQTVDDFTFIAAKAVKPAMASNTSSTRPKEAIIFIRAGGYKQQYAVWIRDKGTGTQYRYTYLTPDNSASGNAEYIQTSQIAATLYRALTGAASAPQNNGFGYGAAYAGSAPTSAPSPLPAGFSVEINGNLIRVYRTDGGDFDIDTVDGVGDTYMSCIKDTVRSFSDLPKQGFNGFVVKVAGISTDTGDDYFVEYVGANHSDGAWRERSAPGVKTTLDPDTMPHALVNTNVDTFELRRQTWSTRIAGDEVSAEDPHFVGKTIQDLFFHQKRLGILTDASCDWSKARNVYTFFPDTVQTNLADGRIGMMISGGETIALTRRAVQVDESLYLWAQGIQFRVHTNGDPFRPDTVEAPPSTAYEFAENADFVPVGTSLYFVTEPEDWASVRNITFQQGRALGDTDVTAHVSEYIPSGVRSASASDTGQMLILQTDGDPNALYLYNFLVQDKQVVQSAWNKWELPEGTICFASIWRLHIYVALQRGGEFLLLKLPLNTAKTDGPGTNYLTRLDLRVDESQCTAVYNDAEGLTTITLPYDITDEEVPLFRAVIRESGLDGLRGIAFDGAVRSGPREVKVKGAIAQTPFYAGLRIDSRRQESTFYLRGEEGMQPVDRLNIKSFRVFFAKSLYTRIEMTTKTGDKRQAVWNPVEAGTGVSQAGTNPRPVDGSLECGVDTLNVEATICMINDTHFPSAWQTAEYRFEGSNRARPARV